MEYCFLKGFVMVLLILHCTSEGLSASVVTLQDGQASPQEPELPPADVVPLVAPPSLEEVQQVVHEASQQVDSRGAEEVLKELLERVVEAALGQVEGGAQAKVDEVAEQSTTEAEVMGTEKVGTETDTGAKVFEQAAEEEEAVVEDMVITGGDGDVEEEQEVSEGNTFEDIAEEEEGVEGEAETAAGPVEETKADVETGGKEAEGVGVSDESPEVNHEVTEKTTLDEIGGYPAVEEAGVEDNKEQVELSEEYKAVADVQEIEETPAIVGVAAAGSDSEVETLGESDHSLSVVDSEQIGDLGEKEDSPDEERLVDEKQGEVIGPPPADEYEMEITQTAIWEPAEQEDVIMQIDTEGEEGKDEQGLLVVEGRAAEEVEGDKAVDEAEGGEKHGDSGIQEESEASIIEGLGDRKVGEEEQIALETFNGSEKEDEEVLVISAPEPDDRADASIERSPGNQAPTTSPSQVGVEAKENTLGNEIINPTDDLSQHDLVAAQPTLDNSVADILTEPPRAEGDEPGEASELVEDTAGSIEKSEPGLEAWKIGAISASVFLALETIVIMIYILKCRDKSSSRPMQRACEEGCVEPDSATRGDCSDDTLPAGNGETQQKAALGHSDLASTLDQNKDQHKGNHAIPMSDFLPSSADQSTNTGPGSVSSQDLRTSVL